MTAQKPLGGRPAFEPTDAQRKAVERLAAFLVPHPTICDLLDNACSPNTLRKHFKKELECGRENVKARLMVTLLSAADRGNVRALCFLIDRMCSDVLPRPVQPIQNNEPQQPLQIVVRGGLAAVTGHDMPPAAGGDMAQ